MNTLSILIYLAEVSGKLATFLGFTAGACAIIVFIFMLTNAIESEKFVFKANFAAAGAILALIAIFIPTSDTIYLIAASEYGETIVTSPEAKELMQGVYDVLKAKIAELKGA